MKVDRNSSVCATIPNNPDVPVHSRYTEFPCTYLTVTQSIDLQHNSTCDSPVEPREKATEPYVNSTGSLTLLLQHGRKVDLHVSTRRGLTPRWKLHRNPEIHVSRERNTEVAASAPDEDLGPGTDCRGIL